MLSPCLHQQAKGRNHQRREQSHVGALSQGRRIIAAFRIRVAGRRRRRLGARARRRLGWFVVVLVVGRSAGRRLVGRCRAQFDGTAVLLLLLLALLLAIGIVWVVLNALDKVLLADEEWNCVLIGAHVGNGAIDASAVELERFLTNFHV